MINRDCPKILVTDKKTKALEKKCSDSRPAKSERFEFSMVNDHFEAQHNTEVSLSLKTQNRFLSVVFVGLMILYSGCVQIDNSQNELPRLRVSENGHFLQDESGEPFFWLGDTGWLLFSKLTREEAELYMDNRVAKGFNVIQVSLIHSLNVKNRYGDSALIMKRVCRPLVTPGNSPLDSVEYDYWDHVDYIIDLAEKKGLYLAIVPVWGNNVRFGGVSLDDGMFYAQWLGARYSDKTNIIWMNGGDTFGNDSTNIWNAIGKGLKMKAPLQLVTFHPRGRCSSSDWFHFEPWLDFNMIQSGHRRYDQDDTKRGYGQDNWRYISDDYCLKPVKPTIDGEPSYEGIPQGLHDVEEPFWTAADVRRYGYWSVFAGAFGYTYGNNAVMQFYSADDENPAFGAKKYWNEAINDEGACQMVYLKELMLSRPFFNRIPNQRLLFENGEKYDYKVATSGSGYAFIYAYRGGIIKVNLSVFGMANVKASWFCPRNGEVTVLDTFKTDGVHEFHAPGKVMDGNDWVLILDVV